VKKIHLPLHDEKYDEFALEGGILGRSDDSISIKGVNIYPGAVEQILRKFDEIIEYRVLLSATPERTDIELQIEPDQANQNNKLLADQVQKQLNAALSIRIPVEIMKPGDLPRFEMKSKRWIRK
jgi:phenylacetate-CoA ligase